MDASCRVTLDCHHFQDVVRDRPPTTGQPFHCPICNLDRRVIVSHETAMELSDEGMHPFESLRALRGASERSISRPTAIPHAGQRIRWAGSRTSGTRRSMVLSIVALILLTDAPAIPQIVDTPTEAIQLRSLMNATRRDYRRPRLRSNQRLARVALSHARKMASQSLLHHNTRLSRRLRTYNWSLLGENVGMGESPSSLHRAFMNSRPHRKNILRRKFRRVGVGAVSSAGRMWVVVVFSD